MSETNSLATQELDARFWMGLRAFSHLTDWLEAAKTPSRVCAVLNQEIPEFRSGEMELLHCDIGHVRYKNDHWTGIYKLNVSRSRAEEPELIVLNGMLYPPGAELTRQASVEGRLGQPGWKAVLPELNLILVSQEAETVLAALSLLTDPEQSRRFLEDSIRDNSAHYRDIHIQYCTPKVVRYKPGSRCTVVYHLGYPADAPESQRGPDLVVAKTYRAEKGRNAFESMKALWDSPLGIGAVVRVAEPLAYNSELRVLIQGPIREERTLKDLMYSVFESGDPTQTAVLEEAMRKTAVGLAALHHSRVEMGRLWTWADEEAEVRDRVERLSAAVPVLRQAAEPLLEKLNTLEAATPTDPPGPAHGSFRPAQVLLYQDEIGFIDFDSFCQSEPANDLALYLSTVLSIGLTGSDEDHERKNNTALDATSRQARFDRSSRLVETFLDEYERQAPVTRRRVYLWMALHLFMFVLQGWVKIKVGELDDIIFLFEQYLRSRRLVEAR